MRIRSILLLSYGILLTSGICLLVWWVITGIRPAHTRVIENELIQMGKSIVAQVSREMKKDKISADDVIEYFENGFSENTQKSPNDPLLEELNFPVQQTTKEFFYIMDGNRTILVMTYLPMKILQLQKKRLYWN